MKGYSKSEHKEFAKLYSTSNLKKIISGKGLSRKPTKLEMSVIKSEYARRLKKVGDY